MTSWVAGNRGITKEIHGEIQEGDQIHNRVALNTQTWRWEASIHEYMTREPRADPKGVNLSARSPERAATRALECLLGMADRGELGH
jgi:hypothetical protein